jgi:hypothetical protein
MLSTFRVLAKLCAQLSSMLIDGNNGLSKLALGSVEPTKALKTLRDKIIVLHMYGKEEKCIIYTYNWLATTEKLVQGDTDMQGSYMLFCLSEIVPHEHETASTQIAPCRRVEFGKGGRQRRAAAEVVECGGCARRHCDALYWATDWRRGGGDVPQLMLGFGILWWSCVNLTLCLW